MTVETTYTSDGGVSTITAKNATTGDQTTKYVHGTDKGGLSPLVYRNDLLRAVIFPDSDDVAEPLGNGPDNTYDRIEFQYDRQGELSKVKDQNGNIRNFVYDLLGRRTQDCLTSVGSGVDSTVRRLATAYDVRGFSKQVTTYDNATVGSGTVLNELVREYDSLGFPSREYQEHQGAKDGNTLYVEWNYDVTASNGELTKGHRLASVRYPNGRLVHYTYGTSGSAADYLGRLDGLKDDNSGSPGSTLASYTYLGLNDIILEDYEEPDVKLDLFGGASGTYAGLDRFGRVVDFLWRDYGASVDRERFQYGYDRASGRLYRDHTVTSGRDEFYTYNGVQRLKNLDRGDLNSGKTAINGTPIREQDWTLDPTGNWSAFLDKTSGTTDLNQSRAHNLVNEITDITESVGTAWVTPVHDRNGNQTTVPKPTNLANGLTLKYDGWNRLVEVTDGSTVVGKYEYDGLYRRIKRHVDSQSPAAPNGVDRFEHDYFNEKWQLLERRTAASASDQPETIGVTAQNVWSPRYIDALILRDRDADANSATGSLGKASSGLEERLYFLNDANMNVTCLVDTGGDPVERLQYDPYGSVAFLDGSFGARSGSQYAVVNTYTGREYDAESGIYYYRMRYYHAQIGQFVGRDPIGEVGGTGLQQYVLGAPLDAMDPLGLLDCKCQGKCKGLTGNFAPTLNAHIDLQIRDANTAAKKAHPKDHKKRIQALRFGVWDKLAKNVGTSATAVTGIEAWIETQVGKKDRDGKISVADGGSQLTFKYAECMRIVCNGVAYCIGSDKMGHFFQQGHMLFEVFEWTWKLWQSPKEKAKGSHAPFGGSTGRMRSSRAVG